MAYPFGDFAERIGRVSRGEYQTLDRSPPVEAGLHTKLEESDGNDVCAQWSPAINGLNLYYEVYGELDGSKVPLLLIPGAFMATDSMQTWAEAFAHQRAVIVFDEQGHGRTPDTSRRMSYEQFGDDARRCCARWESSARTSWDTRRAAGWRYSSPSGTEPW